MVELALARRILKQDNGPAIVVGVLRVEEAVTAVVAAREYIAGRGREMYSRDGIGERSWPTGTSIVSDYREGMAVGSDDHEMPKAIAGAKELIGILGESEALGGGSGWSCCGLTVIIRI